MRHDAIRNVYANAVTISGDSDVWDADGNVVVIDEALVQAEVARLQAEYDSQEYARLRKAAYPSIEECVHSILDDDLVALQAKRADVKARFPK
jgi:hypothetical protein